ncbi:MAG: starch-binding protein [Muribaculaceae bacterium]|nr:starch-binding protein [Muribaculaceae bacterium]
MIFKFGRFLLIPVLILSVLVGVTGCADEISPQFNETGRKPDGAYISVRIPLPTEEMQTRAATRADYYSLDENEGKINDLHLLLYEAGSTSGPAISKTWSSEELSALSIGEDGYLDETIVDLDLTKSYNLYVVANLQSQSYVEGAFSTSITESALKSLVFDWTSQPTADNLPMIFTKEGIDPNQANEIIADMTIAAVKVRYNVVFDPRIFGSKAEEKAATMPKGLQITGVSIENVADRANVVQSTATSSLHSEAITHTGGSHYDVSGKEATGEGGYYNENNIDNDGVVSDKINLAGLSEARYYTSPWVYQGTLYLPERYAAEDADPTSMTFSAEILDEDGGKLADTSFTIPNLAERGVTMERGKYHEWVCMVGSNGDALISEVTVSPWTSQSIVYNLHGTYELIVEVTQSIEVLSGKWTTFGYSSDTDISISKENMPNITDEDGNVYPFYRVEKVTAETLDENNKTYEFTDEWPNHLRIMVNPDIPYYILKEVSGVNDVYIPGETHYSYNGEIIDYFHITAGNINKRIAVGPLKLDAFLDVNPDIIVIDMQTMMAAGAFSDDSNVIRFQTNVKNRTSFTLTITDEDGNMCDMIGGLGTSQSSSEPPMTLVPKGDILKSPVPTRGVYDLNEGVMQGEFTLQLRELLSGNDFWLNPGKYYLHFKIESTNLDVPLEDVTEIEVKPFSTNFIVHFKDNTKNWKHPHIYVYQLLTMPTDLIDKETGKLSEKAGKTVGYADDSGNFQGAVQYLFSNNVSFRGWKDYGGPDDDLTDPYRESYYSNSKDPTSTNYTMGFVVFGKPKAKNWGEEFNPWGDLDERFIIYNYDGNLNADHEKGKDNWYYKDDNGNKVFCQKCYDLQSDYNGPGNNRAWPGIAMEYEGDGWWKYTLSGIAQPGRTFIMFSEGHDGDNLTYWHREDYRWPADSQNGVPLFDYTNREGWFLFDGNTTNHDQNFNEEEPVMFEQGGEQYPSYFSAQMLANLRIKVEKPVKNDFWEIKLHDVKDEQGNDVPGYHPNTNEMTTEEVNGITYYVADIRSEELTKFINKDQIYFGIHLNAWADYSWFTLRPCNFTYEDGKYVAIVKCEFRGGEKLYLKWRDEENKYSEAALYWKNVNNGGDGYINIKVEGEYYSYFRHNKNDVVIPAPGSEVTDSRIIKFKPYQPTQGNLDEKEFSIFQIQSLYYPADGCYHVTYDNL